MRLDHVGFLVDDLEAAMRRLDGLPFGPVEEFDAEDTREVYVEIAPVRLLLQQRRSPRCKVRGHHLGFDGAPVAPKLWRELRSGATQWLLAERVLVEVSKGMRPPAGPEVFGEVVVEMPSLVTGQKLFAELGIEADVPIRLRKGTRGIVEVNLGKRAFSG